MKLEYDELRKVVEFVFRKGIKDISFTDSPLKTAIEGEKTMDVPAPGPGGSTPSAPVTFDLGNGWKDEIEDTKSDPNFTLFRDGIALSILLALTDTVPDGDFSTGSDGEGEDITITKDTTKILLVTGEGDPEELTNPFKVDVLTPTTTIDVPNIFGTIVIVLISDLVPAPIIILPVLPISLGPGAEGQSIIIKYTSVQARPANIDGISIAAGGTVHLSFFDEEWNQTTEVFS